MSGNTIEWHWSVGVTEDEGDCTECGHNLKDDVYFHKGCRKLCLDCLCMVLNAREDYIRELKSGE